MRAMVGRFASASFVTHRRGWSVVSVVAGTVQRKQARTRLWGGRMTVTIDAGETSTADLSAYLPLLARLRNGARLQPDWSALVDDAVEVWARPGFDTSV